MTEKAGRERGITTLGTERAEEESKRGGREEEGGKRMRGKKEERGEEERGGAHGAERADPKKEEAKGRRPMNWGAR